VSFMRIDCDSVVVRSNSVARMLATWTSFQPKFAELSWPPQLRSIGSTEVAAVDICGSPQGDGYFTSMLRSLAIDWVACALQNVRDPIANAVDRAPLCYIDRTSNQW